MCTGSWFAAYDTSTNLYKSSWHKDHLSLQPEWPNDLQVAVRQSNCICAYNFVGFTLNYGLSVTDPSTANDGAFLWKRSHRNSSVLHKYNVVYRPAAKHWLCKQHPLLGTAHNIQEQNNRMRLCNPFLSNSSVNTLPLKCWWQQE